MREDSKYVVQSPEEKFDCCGHACKEMVICERYLSGQRESYVNLGGFEGRRGVLVRNRGKS